jgi:hydroxypyruvate isomerase
VKFAANLSMLYPEHGFLDRFGAAAADGFRGVEYVSPYEHPPQLIAELLQRHGLEQVLFNSHSGDWAAGERGLAALVGREAEFAAGIETSIIYAQALGCRKIHVMAGIVPPGADREAAEALFVKNLRHACDRFAAHGITALMEPINQVSMPGYLMSTLEQAERIRGAVAHDNLRLQFDFFHIQMSHGDALEAFARLLPRIGHVQIADAPGRHEPSTGDMDYAAIFAALKPYDGWIGAEYIPSGPTSAGLGWRA